MSVLARQLGERYPAAHAAGSPSWRGNDTRQRNTAGSPSCAGERRQGDTEHGNEEKSSKGGLRFVEDLFVAKGILFRRLGFGLGRVESSAVRQGDPADAVRDKIDRDTSENQR